MKRQVKRLIEINGETQELAHRRWCLEQAKDLRLNSTLDVEAAINVAQQIYDWTVSGED